MRKISYSKLLQLDQQIKNHPGLRSAYFMGPYYKQPGAGYEIAPEVLWHNDVEMVHDFEAILQNPLIIHWLFDSVGLDFQNLRLDPIGQRLFYRRQTNFFVEAVLLLVQDETILISTHNFRALQHSLAQDSVNNFVSN
ncbi:hypothetical protein FC83_GL000179 [Agrilactobacillus composti DSM 18527 = JCM 14202]|uniref:Uncharacterized protein n=1 Tax=Agrilactobacillus composti DSM 18527 = JCM 14202 TaxID=1423734 RepID=X0PQ72_9LACO|nr:hypothetical protein [Agrilactobacillus composti]KRM32893.1 hypothetical protein FC83_GL000179 [Agrilactobacillus composti DSM 18527 = JCM 14202]GAF39201.1 hypothetical protein JCM14202_1046 [Agrilactobacillus composti DSM 18527 = JCM 14202]